MKSLSFPNLSVTSLALSVATWVVALGPVAVVAATDAERTAFTDRHCSSCHNDVDQEAGLDLTNLTFAPNDPANFLTWVKVHDRIQAGDMPPKEKRRPAAAELTPFVAGLADSLTAFEREKTALTGRATQRRLNRYEYENALRDLLQAPWLQIKSQLPEDGEAFRYNKVSRALDVSHVHMARYMSAADYAMRQAMSAQLDRPARVTKRYYARDEPALGRNFQLQEFNTSPERTNFPVLHSRGQPDVRAGRAPLTVGEAEPEIRNQEAIGKVASTFADFGGYSWTQFRAPVAARFKIRFSGYTIWVGSGAARTMWKGTGAAKAPVDLPFQWFRPNTDDVTVGRRDEPIGVYGQTGGQKRRIGAFDFTPEPSVSELEVMLMPNEVIQTDPNRLYRSRTTGELYGVRNPLAQIDGMPGVAVQWIEVDGPIYDESTGAGYRELFGDLPLKKLPAGQDGLELDYVAPAPARGGRGGPGGGGRGGPPLAQVSVDVGSADPAKDADRLLRSFMRRAYRRPVVERDVQRFLGVIQQEMKTGHNFAQSMVAGYTAVLASPGFVFIDEQPGRLDDFALATRLAFFLWNSEPDLTLRELAARGELSRPGILRAQTERLLSDPRSQRFVDAFLDYWIDVRKMDDTSPSSTLYNDYELDDPLKDAALEETRLFFAELLRGDLPARNVIHSDFTFLNERLATHYGVPGVKGAVMRRVSLPSDSPRGGVMTQASVLKVTANGTTTSPVLRGVWIVERILGQPVPLPPASVPAVDPDIRGAVTIRQQLEKHRADESCAACHRKIDGPGFALESFDVMGGWRDRYRAESPDVEPEPGFGINGWPFMFHYALPVEANGELPDGRTFKDIRDFKQLLLQDEPAIARNLARQMVIYATAAPVRFGDRAAVERIITAARPREFGVRSLVHEIVQSDLFRSK
jgi:Protein of unknown function (DUF1592)/Protein of unknown function (DUF1588)/Protein of unknown function (DUF1585)/Protein of unknown function (DUF1587)/Protein of unknown function (DUF1595)/Planctomycete cytochrome C